MSENIQNMEKSHYYSYDLPPEIRVWDGVYILVVQEELMIKDITSSV